MFEVSSIKDLPFCISNSIFQAKTYATTQIKQFFKHLWALVEKGYYRSQDENVDWYPRNLGNASWNNISTAKPYATSTCWSLGILNERRTMKADPSYLKTGRIIPIGSAVRSWGGLKTLHEKLFVTEPRNNQWTGWMYNHGPGSVNGQTICAFFHGTFTFYTEKT